MLLISCSAYSFHAFFFHSISITQPEDTRELLINVRKNICKQLEFMGLVIDEDANNIRGEEKLITKPESKIKAYIIPTNEELMIAKETEKLVKYI